MVDPDQLDRVRAVYFDADGDEKGLTKVSADLRAGEKDSSQTNSIYPVHVALGLSTSRALLLGSTQIISEGPSDQFYLSAIKTFLIGQGLISPKRELLFLSAGGAKSIKSVATILRAKDDTLPIVVLDGDKPGKQTASQLRQTLYSEQVSRIILLSDVLDLHGAEIEDLVPIEIFSEAVDRCLRDAEEVFLDFVNANEPVVNQVESFALRHDLYCLDHGKST